MPDFSHAFFDGDGKVGGTVLEPDRRKGGIGRRVCVCARGCVRRKGGVGRRVCVCA